jgi:hypothetical protein
VSEPRIIFNGNFHMILLMTIKNFMAKIFIKISMDSWGKIRVSKNLKNVRNFVIKILISHLIHIQNIQQNFLIINTITPKKYLKIK